VELLEEGAVGPVQAEELEQIEQERQVVQVPVRQIDGAIAVERVDAVARAEALEVEASVGDAGDLRFGPRFFWRTRRR